MPSKTRRSIHGLPLNTGDNEIEFLNAVSHGNLAYVRSRLSGDVNKKHVKIMLHLKDSKDRTPLEIATENEHLEIVLFIIEEHGRYLGLNEIHGSLMLAISKGYLNITQVLLGHPCYDEKKNRAMQTLGRHENFYDPNYHCKFGRDVTPIMLAAMCNEVDIIRLLLDRGDDVVKPHHPLCGCTPCLNRKEYDPLMHSLSIINAYKALCSEAYISLTSEDPILTAFLLSKELDDLCRTEKEFKNEYKELIKKCKTYASNLLDNCQNTKEVRTILKQKSSSETEVNHNKACQKRPLGEKTDVEKEDENALPRLEMAIKYQHKQFVAHPHCQHHLSTLWYQGLGSIREMNIWKRVVFLTIFVPLIPVTVALYLIWPKGKFGHFMRSPIIKFINQAGMYMIFLLLMFMESVIAGAFRSNNVHVETILLSTNSCRPFIANISAKYHIDAIIREDVSIIEKFIFIFIVGLIWQEMKQIYREGLNTYVSSVWSWIDLVMLTLLLSSLVIISMSSRWTKEAENFFKTEGSCEALVRGEKEAQLQFCLLTGDRREWYSNDLYLIAEGLFAMANVLSFSRLSFILPASEFLGPLQISLGRMMGDILRFAAMFTMVFVAFFCAMCNLYWYYPQDTAFGSILNAFGTLMWALFGLGDKSDISCPDTAPSCGHSSTEAFGVLLYGSYMGIMVVVMLNMLIAMMSTSFDEINNDEDVEWKFARSKLWLSFFKRGATLPVPFNLIPSPKTIINSFMWVSSKLIKKNSSKRTADHRTISESSLQKALRRNVTSHEDLMKKIVKRYLFQLQRSLDTDEVDEGELEEIKNDISSFRYDVLEKLDNLSAKIDSKKQSAFHSNTNISNGHVHGQDQREGVVKKMRSIDEENSAKHDEVVNEKLDELSKMMTTMQAQISQMTKTARPDS